SAAPSAGIGISDSFLRMSRAARSALASFAAASALAACAASRTPLAAFRSSWANCWRLVALSSSVVAKSFNVVAMVSSQFLESGHPRRQAGERAAGLLVLTAYGTDQQRPGDGRARGRGQESGGHGSVAD